MPEVALSLGALLADGAARLRAAGLPEPRREAVRIWADSRGVGPAEAVLGGGAIVEPETAADFRERIARRAAGEPLAYVTGWAGFRRLLLRSDRRALIPRPETEGLVDLVLARAPAGRVADVGTGTGCIALSLATEGRYEAVVAVDRSDAALALARVNRALVGAEVHLVRSDLCHALAAGSLDALVSNPPYLTEQEYQLLDPAVRRWEPESALPGGPRGIEPTVRLLDDGRRVLRPGGWIAVEVDCTRAAECARRAAELGWGAVAVHNDLFGRERFLLAQRRA